MDVYIVIGKTIKKNENIFDFLKYGDILSCNKKF